MPYITEFKFCMYQCLSSRSLKVRHLGGFQMSVLIDGALMGPLVTESSPAALISPIGWIPRIAGSKGMHIFKALTALWIG